MPSDEEKIREGIDNWFASTSEVYCQPIGSENWRGGLTRYIEHSLTRPRVPLLSTGKWV